MKNIIFQCQTITPMFMSGADNRSLELRAPSLKGIMRFWWRAIQAENDIKGLRKWEMQLFGGTGDQPGRSSFCIRILNVPQLTQRQYPMLPHRTDNSCINRAAIIDTNFNVVFSFRNSSFDPKHLQALFLLTSILGGAGKRNRRGFGSFRIVSIDGRTFDEAINIDYILTLLDLLKPGLYHKTPAMTITSSLTAHPSYPYIQEIEVGRPSQSMDMLLKTIGQASHDHNSCYTGSGNPRLASPVYVSVIKDSKQYYPVITTLTCPSGLTGLNTQASFKGAIL